MRAVSSIAQSAISVVRTRVSTDSDIESAYQAQSEAVGQIINELFRELRTIRTAWRQAWPDKAAYQAAKAVWVRALFEGGVCTQEQIDMGLARCRAEETDFIPSPGKFIGMCMPTPEMVGLPAVETAYEQAMRNCHPAMRGREKWFHPAVYHATAAAGFHSLPLLSRELGLASFEKRYQVQVCRVWRGEDLGPIPLAELSGSSSKSAPEVGNSALAELRAKRSGGSR
ncbi:replication protein P [Pseudomonas syringae]|uniref:replication protein P n=1 Tax=Pseudomonas syringae TaxID=317 RepID=UPI003204E96C